MLPSHISLAGFPIFHMSHCDPSHPSMFLNLAYFPSQACGTAQNMESPKLVWKEEGDHLGNCLSWIWCPDNLCPFAACLNRQKCMQFTSHLHRYLLRFNCSTCPMEWRMATKRWKWRWHSSHGVSLFLHRSSCYPLLQVQ